MANNRKRTNKKSKPIFRKVNASKTVANKRRANMVSLIKDINYKMSERKYLTKTQNTGLLNHNTIYQYHLWGPTGNTFDCLPVQSITDGGRIGDRIMIEGFKVRCLFQIPGDRRNTTIALYYVPHNSEHGDPSSSLFHNITGSTMVDPLQKKRFPRAKLIGKFRVKPADQYTYIGGAHGDSLNAAPITAEFWIPINKKVFFSADATIVPTNLMEYGTICVCPYQQFSTLSTDNLVVNSNLNATCYFKDI